jgi:carboxyl-terminal processing protease
MAHRDSNRPYLAVRGKKMIPLLCGWLMMMTMNAVVTKAFVMKGPLCRTFHSSSVVSLFALRRESSSFHPAKDEEASVKNIQIDSITQKVVPHRTEMFPKHLSKSLATACFAVLLTSSSLFLLPPPPVASASDYTSLSPEQKFVAEAWRTIDGTYLDRTFNGQDWFKIRQDLVKRKYKSMDEAQTALSQMMSTLGDKYTRYLSPAKYQSLVDSATGTLAGVGVEIATNRDGQVIVSDVEPNSPAQKGGLLPNDIFVEANGEVFDKSSTPDDVALRLRGPEGSRVGVVVNRNGDIKDFIITRQPIKVTSVRSYMGSNGVGVIRVKSFSGTTASMVSEQWTELQKKSGAKSLLLDLRGNPGGLLPGGVDTASLFLEANKPVVYIVSNKGVVDSQQTFTNGVDLESPIVILVDHNTASAAEVFAAAMQENGRAKLVGEQTFGKGIIQTIRPLADNNGGVAVTLARYETPNHKDINKQGIPVDTPTNVECPKDDAMACVPLTVFSK